MSINPYMFRHRSAILRVSTKTKEHKSNTSIHVIIAHPIVIEVLYINFVFYNFNTCWLIYLI